MTRMAGYRNRKFTSNRQPVKMSALVVKNHYVAEHQENGEAKVRGIVPMLMRKTGITTNNGKIKISMNKL